MLSLQKKHVLPLMLIVITAIILVALNIFKPAAEKARARPEPAVQIDVITATPTNYTVKLSSQGLVKAKSASTLAAQVSGNVVEVSEKFRRGGKFNVGDWLLTIDPRNYEASLSLAAANERKAQLALQEEQARAEQALRDWQRLAMDEPAPELALRKPQLAAAEAELVAAKAQLRKAQLDLERTRITAPYAGVVLQQLVDLGHFVNPGTQLAEIASSSSLEVALPISAQWRNLLAATKQNANVDILSHIGQQQLHWPARIVRTSGEIDDHSRQFSIIAEIELYEESTPALLIGDYVTAIIEGKTLQQVYVLPRPSLSDGRYAWRVENDRLYKVEVNVVWQDKDIVVIDKGLSDGDLINITPVTYLVSGLRANIIKQHNNIVSLDETNPEGITL